MLEVTLKPQLFAKQISLISETNFAKHWVTAKIPKRLFTQTQTVPSPKLYPNESCNFLKIQILFPQYYLSNNT